MSCTFTMKLAEVSIGVTALFSETKEFCREYLTDIPPVFSVTLQPEDILFEQKKSNKEAELEGIPAVVYPKAYLETLALYRKIADKIVSYGVLLFHGSVISVDGVGYLFTAKSGTGKSTHTRLWREYFGDRAVMVNDDKPLLRVSKEGVIAYGTPWDGKHHLSNNVSVPLKAICILKRGEENAIARVGKLEAYSVLCQQSYRSSNPVSLLKSLELLDVLGSSVGLYELHCNMERDSARVAYEGMQS